jgi:hypothetical protein
MAIKSDKSKLSRVPAELQKIGFVPPSGVVTPRLVLSIEALEKQGKTHFALTAPDPMAYFNFDTGEEGVIHKFINSGKEIIVNNMEVPKDQEASGKEWDRFEKAYYKIFEHKYARTVVVDTGTEMWELVRMAKFGKLTQVMPHHYGPVNAVIRRMIRHAFSSDKNLILIHKLKPRYVNDKRTADYDRAGFSDIGYLVQANIRLFIDEEEGNEFTAWIKDCRHDPALKDELLAGPLCNFPSVAMMMLPEVDPEIWGEV